MNAENHLQYLLTAYLFDNLSAAGRQEVEAHLYKCAACRAELSDLRATAALVEDALGARPAPEQSDGTPESEPYSFEARRLERILTTGASPKPRAAAARELRRTRSILAPRSRWLLAGMSVAAAALLFVFAGLLVQLNRRTSTQAPAGEMLARKSDVADTGAWKESVGGGDSLDSDEWPLVVHLNGDRSMGTSAAIVQEFDADDAPAAATARPNAPTTLPPPTAEPAPGGQPASDPVLVDAVEPDLPETVTFYGAEIASRHGRMAEGDAGAPPSSSTAAGTAAPDFFGVPTVPAKVAPPPTPVAPLGPAPASERARAEWHAGEPRGDDVSKAKNEDLGQQEGERALRRQLGQELNGLQDQVAVEKEAPADKKPQGLAGAGEKRKSRDAEGEEVYEESYDIDELSKRLADAPKVTVESRYLELQSDQLEAIGVDFGQPAEKPAAGSEVEKNKQHASSRAEGKKFADERAAGVGAAGGGRAAEQKDYPDFPAPNLKLQHEADGSETVVLDDGQVVRVEHVEIPVNDSGSARILLSNAGGPVQGYVTHVTPDPNQPATPSDPGLLVGSFTKDSAAADFSLQDPSTFGNDSKIPFPPSAPGGNAYSYQPGQAASPQEEDADEGSARLKSDQKVDRDVPPKDWRILSTIGFLQELTVEERRELQTGDWHPALIARRADAERGWRAFAHYKALDPKLSVEGWLAHPVMVSPPAVGDEGLGAELFKKHYGVNPFVDTRADHFSTFAMDVDTASYTRARDQLRAGTLPDPRGVRVEEFVNFMKQDYVADPAQPFSAFFEGGPSPFGGEKLELLKVTVKARELAANERRPVAITFAIDTSGSMFLERRLELVRESAESLLASLSPDDRIAIVAYGAQPYLALPLTPVREIARIRGALASLTPSGSTNVEAGLDLAYRLSDENFSAKALNRVILCSDGVATEGARSAEQILKKARVYAERGIYLSVLGFGKKRYNDRFLEQLADKGNGNYAYIDSSEEGARIFRENLPATLEVLARDAKIQVDFNPGAVSHYRLLGYENRDVRDEDFRNDAVDAGEVGPGTTVTALYEIRRHPTGTGPLGTLFVRFFDTTSGGVEEQNFPIVPGVLATNAAATSDRFKAIVGAAELAEMLRSSYWAQDGSYGSILRWLSGLSPDAWSRPEIQELVELVARAQELSMESLVQRLGMKE